MAEQVERAFQKQKGVFQARKVSLVRKGKHKEARFWMQVGLGFKTPKEAIEGNFVDKKCPFTSPVNIRGRILKGVVRTAKMKRTVILRRDYLHYIRKYNRYEKRHHNLPAHCSPCFRVIEGESVTVGECRPLSKTVRCNVLKIDRAGAGAKGVKLFSKF